jgi:hypothetical protein
VLAVTGNGSGKAFIDAGINAILIDAPDKMGIKGEDIYEDADAFLEKINLDKEIAVPHYAKMNEEEEF